MNKILKVTNEKACIGCDLCVLLSSILVNNKLSINKSPIDVKRVGKGYKVSIDPGVHINSDKIVNICPTGVFSIEQDDK
ncbi:MAG: hypothetical protein O2871_00670 [bacterium]|nr:hypothetical protein [bacterium]